MNAEGSEMQQLAEADITAFLHFIYMGRLPTDSGMERIIIGHSSYCKHPLSEIAYGETLVSWLRMFRVEV